jgi:uncharacterized protein
VPSETKFKGGEPNTFNEESFLFPELFEKRMEILQIYQNFLDTADEQQLMKLFGTKKEDILHYYKGNIFKKEILKVINRYDGVAFDYLDYKSLNEKSQSYIDQNVIIFSNLFGPLKAGDIGIPDYKLKQGEKLDCFAIEKFYNEHFTASLDQYLENEDVLDLRAGFYEKFYKIKKNYTTMKFIKDGKVVSHWAKAYRGIILKELSKNNTNTIEELMELEIPNLTIEEIKKIKNKTELIYNIVD